MTESDRHHLLISARSFGRNDQRHLDVLRDYGFVIHELREGENAEKGDVLRLLPSIEAWVVSTFPVTGEVLRHCKKMRVIVKHGVGVDNIDLAAATAQGIPVLNAPGSNHVPVADLAMTHLLSLTRRIVEAHRSVQEGRWERFLGTGVFGKNLGIVGVGRIGQAIAKRAEGFGIRCLGYDPYVEDGEFEKCGISRVQSPRELFEMSDFVSVNVPLTDETRDIVSDETIQYMKRNVIIINTSRGTVVNEAAIVRALEEKRIAGYATDVFEDEPPIDSPLLRCSNVQFTPHIASYTIDAMRSLGESVIQGICEIYDGRRPKNILNPEVLR